MGLPTVEFINRSYNANMSIMDNPPVTRYLLSTDIQDQIDLWVRVPRWVCRIVLWLKRF